MTDRLFWKLMDAYRVAFYKRCNEMGYKNSKHAYEHPVYNPYVYKDQFEKRLDIEFDQAWKKGYVYTDEMVARAMGRADADSINAQEE